MSSGLEALQTVQYVTVNGKRLAVLDQDDWETMLEWLETFEDFQIAKQAISALNAASGNRKKAGWLKWDEVKGEL